MKQPTNSYGFGNEQMLDFNDERVRRKVAEALVATRADFGKTPRSSFGRVFRAFHS